MRQHPDSPRSGGGDADDELNDVTRERQQDLGHPHLDEELDRSELGDDSAPGQNSDWMPQ
jgi:hypothetical protein